METLRPRSASRASSRAASRASATARGRSCARTPTGFFTLRGLGARTYRLGLFDPVTLAVGSAGPFSACSPGADERARVPFRPEGVASELTGRVVDPGGRAVAGVRLESARLVHGVTFGEVTLLSNLVSGPSATSDEEGRFRIRAIPRAGVTLRIEARGIVPTVVPLDTIGAQLECTVERAAWLVVEVADPGPAVAVALEDAEGQRLQLQLERAGDDRRARQWPLDTGRTPALRVPVRASLLRLLDEAGASVRDVPLTLSAGERRTLSL